MIDGATHKTVWRIEKVRNGEDRPYEVVRFEGNIFLNEGINLLWDLACGAGGTPFDNANAYIGVGDSNAAAVATQTGLQAGGNKFYQGMVATYPTSGVSQIAVFRAAIGDGDGEYDWNEFTVANGNSGAATNLNRKVQAAGTKGAGETWTVTMTITIS